MRTRIFVLIGALALLFGPSTGLTQFGQPGSAPGGGGGRGFGGMGQFDPNQLFNMMSGGKDVIVGSDITDPGMKMMFDRTVQRMGITNGQISRQQFVENIQQRMAQRAAQGAAAAAPGGTTPNVVVVPAPNAPGFGGQGGQGWPGANPWGANPWGANPWGGFGNPGNAIPQDDGEEEVKKPVVYRGNNLPRELDWFQQLDTDHDGQVALYEWKTSGRSIEEFQKRDLNGDGFITVEEILKYEAKYNPKPKTDPQTILAQGNGSQGNFGPGNFAGRGGNFGPGAFQRGNFGPGGNFGQGGGGRRGGFGQGGADQNSADGQAGGFQRNRPQDGQGDGGNGRNRGGRGGRGQRGGDGNPNQQGAPIQLPGGNE